MIIKINTKIYFKFLCIKEYLLTIDAKKRKKENVMFCIKCGAKNPEYAKFCYKCGSELCGVSGSLEKDVNDRRTVNKVVKENKNDGLTTLEEDKLSPVLKAVFELFIVLKERREVISRNDFWLSQIMVGSITIFLSIICFAFQWNNVVYTFIIFYALLMIDTIIRRLHDTNKSGAYILVILIPIVGQIVLLIMLCLPRVEEDNQWIEKQRKMLNK